MRINVAQLLKSAIGTVRHYEIAEMLDITGDGTGSMVRGEVSLTRTNRGVLVSGILYAQMEASCSRCLASFDCPLTLSFEEEYFPTIDIITGTPLSLPDDEPACFTIDEHHEIDLTEAIRQYAIMATPMKPLCREDCAGLCSTCGHNLNDGRCDCPTEQIDPRWFQLLAQINKRKG